MKNLIKIKVNKLKKLKAFTLIEMLIVIVIIGILAAALIPKLNSARGRANDVARKADLSQVAAGLISYQIDKGGIPNECGNLSSISGALLNAGLNELPIDPDGAEVEWLDGNPTDDGNYGYCAIEKNNQDAGGFVVMSISETEGGANYVMCDDGDSINHNDENLTFSDIQKQKCNSFTESTCFQGSDSDGECGYEEGEGQLRYIYMQ